MSALWIMEGVRQPVPTLLVHTLAPATPALSWTGINMIVKVRVGLAKWDGMKGKANSE